MATRTRTRTRTRRRKEEEGRQLTGPTVRPELQVVDVKPNLPPKPEPVPGGVKTKGRPLFVAKDRRMMGNLGYGKVNQHIYRCDLGLNRRPEVASKVALWPQVGAKWLSLYSGDSHNYCYGLK